jgi:hypothetical protein
MHIIYPSSALQYIAWLRRLNLFGRGGEPTVSGTASEPSKNKECLEF